MADGVFADEIVAVTVKDQNGKKIVDTDEGPRPNTTLEDLAALRTVFDSEGTVTAGNASVLSDGAAALLLIVSFALFWAFDRGAGSHVED